MTIDKTLFIIPLPERHAFMNFSRVTDNRKHFGVFPPFIGGTLRSIRNAQYHFNGEPAGPDVGPVELKFESDRNLLLSLASDGETVIAEHGTLDVPTDFHLDSDSHCSWVLSECDNQFVGQRLIHVDAQIDRIGDSSQFTSGWILSFESGFLGYHNFGDDAYLLYNEDSPPHAMIATTLERIAG